MHSLLYRTTSAYLCRSSVPHISRQISLRFSSLANMNRGRNDVGYSGRGRGSNPSGNSAISNTQGGSSPIGRQTSLQKTLGSISKHSDSLSASHYPYEQNPSSQEMNSAGIAGSSSKQPQSFSVSNSTYDKEFPPLSANFSSKSKIRGVNKNETAIKRISEERAGKKGLACSSSKIRRLNKSETAIEQKSEERAGDNSSLQFESSPVKNSMTQEDEFSPPTNFGKKGMASRGRRREHVHSYPNSAANIGNSDYIFVKKGMASRGRRQEHVHSHSKYAVGVGNSDCSESLPMIEPFDICHSESRKSVSLNPSLHTKNQEIWSELEQSMESISQVLRPGMVLLKRFITHSEQIEIVKKCRELGLGPGGFYQPSYKDGAKLRLQMMCLGLNWDPETRKYDDQRPVDGSKPPSIPEGFSSLVERAIQDSHALIKKDLKVGNVEEILPRMCPNICIVNFYTTSGRLGLHQDRDESKESLLAGLPVISFSIGDSAEFLYGDQRDVNKAENVILDSGDVLIFGGKSRHIFHGVPSIIPNSAPPALMEEAKIRPGRLNLTFREY
ncbi:hypothetical protein L1049_009030 [Liquidambar formosana]|uniref:DNA N(6)-methyladenine demethylase n=1 Tax=Liquidambar formosana TaxID=63359 RepID=A0AAP0SAC5_LIQFO